ncbi:MAG TPA: AMP-binding protein [Candidatus Nanopelagicales bacterium]|nr:AMP-binding protein [Candidatus Nanopelagicales bacterium]
MTLTRAWAEHWRSAPDRAVIVDARDSSVLTGADLLERTASAASALAASGAGRGERVLLSRDPSPTTVVAYAAILRLGAAVVPANTGYTRGELEHIVRDVRPVVAVVDDPARLEGLGVPTITLGDLQRADARAVPALDHENDAALAMVAYTSGTTGRSKGAMLSRGNLRAGAEALVEAWEWTPDDRLVHALPMFHMHGLGAAINGTLTAGSSMVVLPRFGASAVVDAAHAHGATMFFGVPTMYARLRDSGRLSELVHLRLLVSGSAPLDPVLFEAVRRETGQAPVERYGMSETVMLVSNPVRGERKAGAVGLPLPGVELRLADAGAVEVNGPNVFRGYWERPDATAAAFTDDGWFRTGDIGELDRDGYLRLVGRASDLIISGGYNVYPREVEDAVLEHPDVVDVAVVGIPDDTWGERVVAFVVLRDGAVPDEAALDAHVSSRLAAYKRPRAWTVRDDLPRNAMGKVLRDQLRDR